MIDLRSAKDMLCVLQDIDAYNSENLVQLGWAYILRDEGRPSGAMDKYTLRVYVDFEQGKRQEEIGHNQCLYEWYMLTVQPESAGRYDCYEVVIGEGPSLEALLSEGYLTSFNFKQPEWWGWTDGLLGRGFKKWLKKHDQTIA